ncbi:MAG: shikimate kinase [Candidatus Acidiferrales bacterium]|jgi:shikimate kinase
MVSETRARTLVCLTGFMGTGKSTVARLLARQVGWQHVDLDKRIVEATGQTIPIIFARLGEPEFRRAEHDQLARILGEAAEQQKPRIVSLGGGTTAQQQNVALLRQSGAALIWLHCPISDLLKRAAHITDRPLFRDEASFRKLYDERLPSYELADYRVETNTEPLRVVEQILALGIFPRVTA